ncbi:nucleolin-like isoform X2 [Cyprinodon tularosa]|uniref:nucleolin-like isoform X2 n=1 Tax=Cyprinodon tularosa TaxID=77115 RepID=UPI0018E23C32|nr:nucleolin-like isoform X2 [Cyprinodon tularosa]
MTMKQNTRHKKVRSSYKKAEDTCNNDIQPEVVESRDEEANGKRKAAPASDSSPSKKTKLSNDEFCLFVGNLNVTKTSEEIKSSLAKYFSTQNLLFQDIRLGHSKKHAFVSMASDMDLNKALTLNGEEILDKPLKMAKAKARSNEQKKAQAPPMDQKVKDHRCLFLKNVPYNATEEDIRKVFRRAVAVRFPGGAKGPSQGIAFVEFKNKAVAEEMLKKKQKAQLQGRDLIVARIQRRAVTNADSKKAKAAAPLSNILFVNHLPEYVRENHLKSSFKNALHIRIPHVKDRPKRFAFVEFASVADAKKALQASKNRQVCKRGAKVEMCRNSLQPESSEVKGKTLFVSGLTDETTAETLQAAFDGAVAARVAVDKNTGASKRFGFVEFDSEGSCRAAKDDMEDCEIDGSKVTVTYAVSKEEGSTRPPSGGKQQGERRRHAAEVIKLRS